MSFFPLCGFLNSVEYNLKYLYDDLLRAPLSSDRDLSLRLADILWAKIPPPSRRMALCRVDYQMLMIELYIFGVRIGGFLKSGCLACAFSNHD